MQQGQYKRSLKKLIRKLKIVKGPPMIPLKEKFAEAQEKRNCNRQKALLNSRIGSTRSSTSIYRGGTSTGVLNVLSEHHAS